MPTLFLIVLTLSCHFSPTDMSKMRTTVVQTPDVCVCI